MSLVVTPLTNRFLRRSALLSVMTGKPTGTPVAYSGEVSVVDGRSETMRKRILAVTAATSLAAGTLAGSALAHVNLAAGKSVGPTNPNASQTGHMGMECGAQNPNTPLVPLAPAVTCPANR